MPRSTQIGVFLSGSGRTLRNLFERSAHLRFPAHIALVVASRECPGAEIARANGVPTHIIPGDPDARTMLTLWKDHSLELIALAGYLRRVAVPAPLADRILNIHPALLPDFGGPGMYGVRVHQAVLAASRQPGGPTESGCTVHICDDEYDRGRILAQRRCPILTTDTADTLAARVFQLECELYPQAIAAHLEALGQHPSAPSKHASH